jgi:hypothetical protein
MSSSISFFNKFSNLDFIFDFRKCFFNNLHFTLNIPKDHLKQFHLFLLLFLLCISYIIQCTPDRTICWLFVARNVFFVCLFISWFLLSFYLRAAECFGNIYAKIDSFTALVVNLKKNHFFCYISGELDNETHCSHMVSSNIVSLFYKHAEKIG